MTTIPYFAVESLMYALVWIQPDIAHIIDGVKKFLVNACKDH